MADGGGAWNDTQSMLKPNPELQIQSFSGGGDFSQMEELERELQEGEFEMEGGANGIVDGFDKIQNAVELSNLMFALGLATRNTIGKNPINEAQAELFMEKMQNIDLGMVVSDYLQNFGNQSNNEGGIDAGRARRAQAQQQAQQYARLKKYTQLNEPLLPDSSVENEGQHEFNESPVYNQNLANFFDSAPAPMGASGVSASSTQRTNVAASPSSALAPMGLSQASTVLPQTPTAITPSPEPRPAPAPAPMSASGASALSTQRPNAAALPSSALTLGEEEEEDDFALSNQGGGGQKGGTINTSLFGTKLQEFYNTLKELSNEFTNFLFLYNDGLKLQRNTINFMQQFEQYLIEAVQAGKLPDWKIASTNTEKVQALINSGEGAEYKAAYEADIDVLKSRDSNDPTLQSLANYNKKFGEAIYRPLKDNLLTLQKYVYNSLIPGLPTDYYNVFTIEDFNVFDTITKLTNVEYSFWKRDDDTFVSYPHINRDKSVLSATFKQGVNATKTTYSQQNIDGLAFTKPSSALVLSPIDAFEQYSAIISALNDPQNNSERRIALSYILISLIREYTDTLAITIQQIQNKANISDIGFKNAIKSFSQLTVQDIYDGVQQLGPKLGTIGSKAANETQKVFTKIGSKSRDAIEAFMYKTANITKIIGSAIKSTMRSLGTAAGVAASTMARGTDALAGLTGVVPGGITPQRTTTGGSRRTIRSRR